jgi:hypothetical protein
MDEHIGLDLVDHVRLIASVTANLLSRLDNSADYDRLYNKVQPEQALALQQEVKNLAGLVRDLVNEADQLLIASLDGAKKAVVGDKVVEVRRAYKRTWDTPLLAGAVAACVLQGERIPEVDKVVEALLAVARMEWRVTDLAKLGIEDERYCEKELGRPTVSVT